MSASSHKVRYDEEFFSKLYHSSRSSAVEIVPLLLAITRCRSVVDIGCGTCLWLQVFMQNSVLDVLGVDGSYVDRNALRIPRSAFLARDLSKPLKLGRRFDLCLCLEVAEHLPEGCARGFVTSLTSLAPIVVFSAAIPGQGGIHHINERWQSYWIGLFRRHGFRASDCIRPRIWGNPKVAWWYAQNMLLFLSPKYNIRAETIRDALVKDRSGIVDVVHPRGLLREAAQFRADTARPL